MTEASVAPTTVEQDGRVFTGVGVNAESIESALAQTSFGQKAESDAAERAEPQAPPPAVTTPATDEHKTRGQRRFDRLTAEREEARKQAESFRLENEALKARLAQPIAPMPAAEPVKAAPQPPVSTEIKLEDFAQDADPLKAFTDAMIKRALGTELDARLNARLEADRASRALQTTIAESWERGRAVYPDFETVLKADTREFPGPILEAIAKAPGTEHIQYALATNSELADRVAKITDPIALGIEFGRLGSGVASARPASPAKPATTQAPPPYQPVSGASRTVGPSLEELAAKPGNYDAYKRERHAAIGGKHR